MIIYILVYDIANKKRLRTIANICVKYLTRVQKSVFEGNLTKSQLYILKKELKKKIEKNEDSVIIYFLRRSSIEKKLILGMKMEDPFLIM